ncbi:unnamed protein product [Caenorhabditis bovis]|uniref:Uncharacterized protein n=1 Tax=Caenorhabditis bovis TaxID=2654633 RepID=A0A8S1EMH5_9PELO|nr:unnamed protein product [Caenorhabditis bovis]
MSLSSIGNVINKVEGTNEVKTAVEFGRALLFEALDALDGEKTIVWDRDRQVMHRVNLFAGPSLLAAHGVVANHEIETKRAASTQHVVFFISATMPSLDLLCSYIDDVANDPKTLYHVFFIPEAWYVIREELKMRNGGKYLEKLEAVKEIPLYWLPRDGECLSLSQPQIPSKLLLNCNWTYLHKCAVTLSQLISMSRQCCDPLNNPEIPLYYQGKWSKDVSGMLLRLKNTQETSAKSPLIFDSHMNINRIVLIDRWIDPLTPMLTQLTYSGIIDELYRIGPINSVKVPLEEFEEKQSDNPFAMKDIYLTDEIYHRLKHSHINAFGQEAAKILTDLRNDEQFDREKMSVAEYAVLVKKMPRILKRKQLTSTHMRLAEMSRMQLYCRLSDDVKVEKLLLESSDGDRILPYIEELIYDAAPLLRVLRLISVHSLTSGGFKSSVLQQYRRIVNQSYGSAALNKMLKMQKMGLIREKGGSGKMACEYGHVLYQQMKKQYDLLNPNIIESKMDDLAYAYSGYAPLLAKILEEGDKLRWVNWQNISIGGNGTEKKNVDDIAEADPRGTCLFVIGGITRAEIAVIRETIPSISLIATTSVITGDVLLENITNI